METIGASHSSAEARQSSSDIMSLRLVEYSRMRPQPVHVKLQVCSGSSCSTMAKRGVRRILCLIMCRAIFAVKASGKRIIGLNVNNEFKAEPAPCRALLRADSGLDQRGVAQPGAIPAGET